MGEKRVLLELETTSNEEIVQNRLEKHKVRRNFTRKNKLKAEKALINNELVFCSQTRQCGGLPCWFKQRFGLAGRELTTSQHGVQKLH